MEKAKEYGISPGKVVFIQKILEENPELDFETLVQMPMSELEKYVYPEDNDAEKNETEIEEPEETEENVQENTQEDAEENEEYESPEEKMEERENLRENLEEDEEDSFEEEFEEDEN